jgi:acyl-CoA synthetase (AMP-forming)/AMP-acid ligase II
LSSPELDRLEAYAERPAVIRAPGEHVTYGELLAGSKALEKYLEPRALVFALCRNAEESLAGYLACLRAKAPVLLLHHTIDRSLLDRLIEAYGPAHLYVPSDRTDLRDSGKEIHRVGSYVLLVSQKRASFEAHPEIAVLMSTSGSTGSPKLVKLSARNLNENAKAIAQYMDIEASDRAITTMPMSYAYGLSIINSHLIRGAALILTELSMVERPFWDLLSSGGATNFGGVPYSYKLLRRLKLGEMPISGIRFISQAGGRLEPELARELAEICSSRGIRFFMMYGQTEATARMAFLPPELASSQAGSIGRAIPGGELWIEDEGGNRVGAPDVVGELVYRGPNVCLGYATGRADLERGDENGGVLRTGDLARRATDGLYFLVGRKSRFAKVFGQRISLDEVEGLCERLGHECACLGAEDLLKIFTTSGESRAAELRGELSRIMRIHPSALRLVSVESIPRSGAGKILYGELSTRG